MIDSKKYVVLDVETNGLSSIRDDLLSISIYKPDDEKTYDRFLPLELSDYVETTWINGITKEQLENKKPLTQEEFNRIVEKFELEKRTILTYGSIDEKFIKNYLLRKKINGFEKLTFYNFKHDIISSRFSEGNITKDNLCRLYGIDNIQSVHSGLNDCILEWKLFEKMNGNKLIIINNSVNEFNSEYVIPASYLQTYPNFKYCIEKYPKVNYEIIPIKSFYIEAGGLKKFDTNISGVTIEHLINVMLNATDMNNETIEFQIQNREKLKRIGELPSIYHTIDAIFNDDGTITAINKEDIKSVREINKVIKLIKEDIMPLIKYIKKDIFNDKDIMSQELVINKKDNVMAKCDLSTDDAILEIKAYNADIEKYKYQLYYESKNREIYLLQTFWNLSLASGLRFQICKVIPKECEDNPHNLKERIRKFEKKIKSKSIKVVEYIDCNKPVKLKCTKCENVWDSTIYTILKYKKCPFCNPKIIKSKKKSERTHKRVVLSQEEKIENRLEKYQKKLDAKSNSTIKVLQYTNSREKVTAKCLKCGYEWTNARADHLLERCHCPKCRGKV